ncbi:MAG: cytochrome b [Methylophaga sp.]|nr:MAG: cytochrome b [Methylophaga sp.]
MLIKNDQNNFGLITILLHWLVALVTFGLFGLGLWMMSLGYYDDWYQQAPDLHEGVGVIFFIFLLIRIVWRWINPPPKSLPTLKKWEKVSSYLAHGMLNFLLLVIAISGYLIITAKGESVQVFDLFNVPASLTGFANQEDIAGEIHLLAAWAVIGLAAIHTLAALKHHFFDKDATLRRIFGLK